MALPDQRRRRTKDIGRKRQEETGMGRRTMTIRGKHGEEMAVAVRDALPVESPCARYPGFRPEELLLPKGSIRLKGYMPLPCDIVLERDVPIVLRDGTTIYTDVFRPSDDQPHPAIVALSPYGKEIGSAVAG